MVFPIPCIVESFILCLKWYSLPLPFSAKTTENKSHSAASQLCFIYINTYLMTPNAWGHSYDSIQKKNYDKEFISSNHSSHYCQILPKEIFIPWDNYITS